MQKHQVTIIFDVDYRPYTWQSEEETSIYYNLAAEKSDLIIGTREEFDMMEKLTVDGPSNDESTANKWFSHHAKIVIIKHGGEGSIAYTKMVFPIAGHFKTKVLKTFGAGDSYASALIYALMNGLTIQEAMRFGSASASIVISKHSSSDAMPSVEEIKAFMATAEEFILNQP